MVRVLNVLLENHIGGPQIRVLSVANMLRNNLDVETIILCPNGEGDFARKAREENFKVFQIILKHPRYINNFWSFWENIVWLFTFPLSVIKIISILDREKIDIVHVNGLFNLQAAFAALLTRKKLVWHLMSLMYPRIIVSLLMPIIKRAATQIIVISEKSKNYYLGAKFTSKDQNVSLIYEGIDVNKFQGRNVSIENITKIKNDLDIGSTYDIIGCVGNINPTKDYETLIKSASIVCNNSLVTRFVIVGDIPDNQRRYFQMLQSLIGSLDLEQHVIFTGRRSDIPDLIGMFDTFVLSSLAEGTPLAILEAMAMEKAVVATNVGAVVEQVVDGVTGIIVPPKNPDEMAKAIIYLLKNPNERVEMGIRGRQRVLSNFSLEKCAEDHKKLYISLSKKKKFELINNGLSEGFGK
jgi:glycosyltransferase involved in cell wall biosynthesis